MWYYSIQSIRCNQSFQRGRAKKAWLSLILRQEYFLSLAAMSGGALTAFELLCDNALMDYIRAAKLRSFGAAHVSAYLAAMENETTAARMILTGRLAGLQPAVIRERLRETYA